MSFLNGTDPGLRQTKVPVVDTYTAGSGFTAGSTTALTLSGDPGNETACEVSFDGILQHGSTFTQSGTTLTFSSAIPTGVTEVQVRHAKAIPATTPADNSVSVGKLSTTGTPSSSTFLRGDMAWAAAGGGKVLQFVSATSSSEPSRTYSGSFTDTGQSVSITPTASGSKLLVEMTISLGSSTQSNAGGKFQLYRDSTNLTTSQWGEIITVHDSTCTTATLRYVDTAPGTSAYEYKLYWFSIFGSGTIYLNRDGGDSYDCPTVMTVTEFDAT